MKDTTKPHYRIADAEKRARVYDDMSQRVYDTAYCETLKAEGLLIEWLQQHSEGADKIRRALRVLSTLRTVKLIQAKTIELDNSSCMPAAVVQGRESAGRD